MINSPNIFICYDIHLHWFVFLYEAAVFMSKILSYLICLLSYCNFIDASTPGDHQDAEPRNTDAMVLCISNTGVFLLQSAINIFIVIYICL
jgi:hypothetical protein